MDTEHIEETVPLADVLEFISSQIVEADRRVQSKRKAGELKGASMLFEECEVEFGINIEKKAEIGIVIKVLNLGGSTTRENTNTIKIKYVKNPENPLVNNVVAEKLLGPDDVPPGPPLITV